MRDYLEKHQFFHPIGGFDTEILTNLRKNYLFMEVLNSAAVEVHEVAVKNYVRQNRFGLPRAESPIA